MKLSKQTIQNINEETKRSINSIQTSLVQGLSISEIVDGEIRRAKLENYIVSTDAYVEKLNTEQEIFNIKHGNGRYHRDIDEIKEDHEIAEATLNEATFRKHSALAGVLFAVQEKINSRGFLYWLRHPINTYRENKALKLINESLKENHVSQKELEIYKGIHDSNTLPTEIIVENGNIEYKHDAVEEENVNQVEVNLDNGDINKVEEQEVQQEVKAPTMSASEKKLLNERRTVIGFMKEAYYTLNYPNQKYTKIVTRLFSVDSPIGVDISQEMQAQSFNKAMENRTIIRNTITGTRAKLYCLDAYRAIVNAYGQRLEATPEEREMMNDTVKLMRTVLEKHNVSDLEMELALTDNQYREKIVYADTQMLKEDIKEMNDLGNGFKFNMKDEKKYEEFYDMVGSRQSSSVVDLFKKGLTPEMLNLLQSSDVELFKKIEEPTTLVSLDEISEEKIKDQLEEFKDEFEAPQVVSELDQMD